MSAVPELQVLITHEQIARKVSEIAQQITRDFKGQSVSSYGNRPSPTQELKSGWDSTGEVRLTKDVDQSMQDRNVILVEDILDTGLTMTYLKKLMLNHQPRALKVAALLDKPSRRKSPIEADYVGFKIPDEFVVGYGLDYAERYRNLPDICVIPRN
jgi:hypoxanthine phosphoribosyltransferase